MGVLNDLCDVLESFGLPVYLQGSLADNEAYPESFYTYYNNDSDGLTYYDNTERRVYWDFDVNAFSDNPDTAQAMLMQARDALRARGYIVPGSGYDIISDEPTHTGRGINATYVERVGNND